MSWEPTSIVREDWGYIQVVISDVDVTFFRDVPVQIQGWSSGEPFGDAQLTMYFPQITSFERIGVLDLWWLYEWVDVDIYHVDPDGNVDRDNPLFEGMVASFDDSLSEDSTGISVECIGALYQLDLYVTAPLHIRDPGKRVENIFKKKFTHLEAAHLRTKNLKVEFPDWWGGSEDPNADIHVDGKGRNMTGFVSVNSGSWNRTLTSFIQEHLALLQEPDGNHGPVMWTMHKDADRQPVLRIKDTRTVDWNVTAGTPGITHDLTRDMSQAPNAFYGEGSDQAGTKWRNSFDVGKYQPLAINARVDPSVNNTYGDPGWEHNPHLDLDAVRHEVHGNYGSGVSLLQAIQSAQQKLRRELDPGWAGTMTLKVDPEEGSRFAIKAGQNIRLRHYRNFGPHYYDSWDDLAALGFVDGTRPHDVAIRGAAAAIVRRTLDYLADEGLIPALPTPTQQHFSDIAGHTFEEDIKLLAEAGITFGFDDGTYRPGEDMTRQAMVAFATRSIEWATGETLPYNRDYFPDDTDNFFEEDINKATEHGFIVGDWRGFFNPNDGAQRIHLTIVMQRMMRYLGDDTSRDKEGLLLHIAQVEVDMEALTVSLTVDSHARDLLTLAEILERRGKDNRNAARMLRAGAESGITSDDRVPWDVEAGFGFMPTESKFMQLDSFGHPADEVGFRPRDDESNYIKVNADAGSAHKRWAFTTVKVQEYGDIGVFEMFAYDFDGNLVPAPFHVGLYGEWFGGSFNVDFMPKTESGVPNPFAEGVFDLPDNIDPSRVILWGQYGQRAGYYPGLESEGNSPTGKLRDEGGFNYTLPDGEAVMWLAIYCEYTEDVYFQGRMFKGSD